LAGWQADPLVGWPINEKDVNEVTGKPDNRQTFPTDITVGDVLRLEGKL
jgi:hypothetical protein